MFVILFLLLHFKLFECYSTLIERLLSSFFLVNFLYLYHLVLQSCTLKWEIHFWQRLNVLTKECGHFYFKILTKEHHKMICLQICLTQPYRFSWKNLFYLLKRFCLPLDEVFLSVCTCLSICLYLIYKTVVGKIPF